MKTSTCFQRRLRLACCSLLVLIVATACTKRDSIYALEKEEAAEAAMAQALEAQRNGQAQVAYELYRDIALMHPTNALAHLQLGIVLQDSLRDPSSAIYHYDTYLRLRPDSEKGEMVANRLKQAKDQMGRRFGSDSAAVDVTALQVEHDEKIIALSKEIHDKELAIKKLQEDKSDLQVEADKMSREISRLQKLVDTVLDKETVSAPSPSHLSEVDISTGSGKRTHGSQKKATPSQMGTWEVKRGDTLWTIAQRNYGDASRNRDIRDANKGKIGPNDTLIEGTILVIP